MKDKILNILHEDLDWVKSVDEYNNFFKWFRGEDTKVRRPGDWIGRNTQWWIDYVQNVDFALCNIRMDITEMLGYAEKIDEENANAKTVMGWSGAIYEFIGNRNGKNEIMDYIDEIQSFIKEFRSYFGESMPVRDMVSSVGESMRYAQKNNTPIHVDKPPQGQLIGEDFDWIVKDTVPFLEVGEPLKKQQPKNQYKLHITHGVGEDYSTWVPNWVYYDPKINLDMLIRHIKILNYLERNQDIWDLAELWTEGETWILSDEDNQNMKTEFGEFDSESGLWVKDGVETDADEARDIVSEWLNNELTDYGIIDYDSYHQGDASIEEWGVTYFDEFGVEHVVKINLPQG